MHYAQYLKLDSILDAQKLESDKVGKHAHDEMLFIIIHQAYELWFKQILFELGSIKDIFQEDKVDDQELGTITSRLDRVNKILKLLVDQVTIIETMTPSSFLEFRNLLNPASGFQSLQFRRLETMLGLKYEDRSTVEKKFFNLRLTKEESEELENALKEKSIKELLDNWLSRLDLIDSKGFSFWKVLRQQVEKMFAEDKLLIENNETLDEKEKKTELENLKRTLESFNILFDQEKFDQEKFSFSRKSMLTALFINLYHDYPLMHLPFKILNSFLEMDEWITKWRYAHALMVKRMLGGKIGTGGSTGHEYLKKTAQKHVLFKDLFKLNSFLIARSQRPNLPENIKDQMSYHYQVLKKNV